MNFDPSQRISQQPPQESSKGLPLRHNRLKPDEVG